MEKFIIILANRNIIIGILCFILFSCNRVSEVSVIKENTSTDSTEIVIDDIVNVQIPSENVRGDTLIVIPVEAESTEEVIIPKKSLTEIYLSQVGVRELTGKNDGPEVEMYLKSVGLGKGYAWCSAFVKWNLDQAEIPNKINAWSPTAENQNHIIFKNKRFSEEPQPGDVGTLYYPKLKRIGHTYFFHRKINSTSYESVEGNTNGGGSRDGDGVYKRIRSFNATHSISRWSK